MSRNKKRRVECSVTGLSNGPTCPTCRKAMDSVTIEQGAQKGEKGHYCFGCTTGVKVLREPQ